MFNIAIDLGGTIIKLGLLKNSELIDEQKVDAQSQKGLKANLPNIEFVINQLLDKHQVDLKDILGIGFSFPGLVNSINQKIISTNKKYDDAISVDLPQWARSNWNLPLFIDNDARVALLGEWQHGAGKDIDNLIMFTIGTGIGTAVLMEGKLLKGKHFQAGNLGGHITINFNAGTYCSCGNRGCIEAEASTWRLPSLLEEHPDFLKSSLKKEKKLDFKTLIDHVKNKDLVATEIFERCISVWSAGLVSLIHAFDPEKIILSGGILNSASLILPRLQENINKYAWTPWGKVQLVKATHIDTAALYGADYMVRSNLNTKN